jgi:hypothetical protein
MMWLDLGARLGFALFMTAGFAAGLGLYTALAPSHPDAVRGCGGIFLWSFVLIWCVTGRNS